MDNFSRWKRRQLAVRAVMAHTACLVALVSVYIQFTCIWDMMLDTEKRQLQDDAEEATGENGEQSSASSAQVSSAPTFPAKGVKRKAPTADSSNEIHCSISRVLGRFADGLFEANRVSKESQHRIYTAEEVYTELTRLEVGDLNTLFAAYSLIMMDDRESRMLFGLPPEMRKQWITWRMLNQKQ